MAGSGVAVVTDSTSYLPAGLAAKSDVTVVPLQVVLDGRVGAEGVDVGPAEVAAALGARRGPVSTSRPAPAAFAAAYAAAAAAGASGVVSVHLSSALSGTVEAAELAAAELAASATADPAVAGSSPARRVLPPVSGAEPGGFDVRVVDSRTVAMGLGFAVIAAAEAAAAGGSVDDVAAAAESAAVRTTSLFYVDTLEHLRRGGRIGAAAALFGSALAVKPILHVQDGRIAPMEKVRTASRALSRMEEIAVAEAGDGPVAVAVHHLAAPGRAEALADRLRARLPELTALYVTEIGAVVGAHVGPGLIGVVVSRG